MAWRMWQRSRWFVGVLLSALAWHSSCALQGAVVILVMLVVGTAQVSMAYSPPGGRMKVIRSAVGSQRSSTCPLRQAPSLSGQKARKPSPRNSSDCLRATSTSSQSWRSQKTRISPAPGTDEHSSPRPALASSLASSSVRFVDVPVDSIPASTAELSSLAPLPAPAASVEAAEDSQKEAEETRRAMEVFLREQLVLSRRGELSLELDTFYSTGTRNEFVRSDGGVALIERTNRTVSSIFIPRYGIIDGLELALAIPFGYAEQEIDFGVARSRTDDFGLGDIAGTLRYQLWPEFGARPALILELEGKSRTRSAPLLGTDHWNVGGGVTLVKTLDPVVFFGRLGYTATLEREGRDPGDQIRYEAGMGFSLNDRVSFKMQVGGAAVGRAELNGKEIAGSSLDIISLLFAVTTRATRHLFVEPVVSIGLTDDTPDVVAGVDLVYQFWGTR